MRNAPLILIAAAAFALSGCGKPAEEAPAATTEAAEASGAAETEVMTAEGAAAAAAAAANAGASTSAAGAEATAPTSDESPSDGTVAPDAEAPTAAH